MKKNIGLVFIVVMVILITGGSITNGILLRNKRYSVLKIFMKKNNHLFEKIDSVFQNSDFVFIYFSDLHNSWRNLTKMIEVANELEVDVVINAGDTVLRYLDDPETDFSWYPSMITQLDTDMLTAVGNHDVWYNAYWKKADLISVFNTILSPVLMNMSDVILPEGAEEQGLCYYYKDYQNVRIIVLNAMTGDESVEFWDDNEAMWLQITLKNALEKGKQVICVSHAPFQKDIAVRDSGLNWNSCIDYRCQKDYDNISTDSEAIQIVQDFIENGGTFICWLSGHTHVDEVLEANNYDGQLMFGISSARYSFHLDGVISEDKEDPNFYCFDLIGVDTKNRILRRVRLGWNMDSSAKVRNILMYDYKNNVILND